MSKSGNRGRLVSPQEELLAVVREKLLPWSKDGTLHTMQAVPPFQVPPEIKVDVQATPLLKPVKTKRNEVSPIKTESLMQWEKHGLTTVRHLNFVFVLEGSADIKIGVTEQMAKRDSRLEPEHGSYILRLPERSLLVIPPDVPRSDGTSAHWESGVIEAHQAHSRILWFNLLPEGAMLHTCCTEGLSHVASPRHFVLDLHLARIAELIVEKLQKPEIPLQISLLLLQSLLLSVDNALSSGRSASDASGQRLPESSQTDIAFHHSQESSNAAIVERACRYIEAGLTQPLTATQIARHSFSSVSHLNRLFQAELGTSVMQFVTERRLEAAQSLLINTNMPVSSIGDHLSYRHLAHFSLVFKQKSGVSPSQYRERYRQGKPEILPSKPKQPRKK